MTTANAANAGTRGPPLLVVDGLRGAAMIVVLVTHAICVPLQDSANRLDATVRAAMLTGWTSVDLFFVLSGFLITGILLDTKGQRGWWGNFAARRILRTCPLYYGALFAVFVILPWISRWSDANFVTLLANQSWYWGYAVNLLAAGTHGGGTPLNTIHFWSLSVEEQFYLMWPVAVWACTPRTLLRVAALIAIGGLAFRLALVLHDPARAGATYFLTPGRLDGLMVGAAAAVAVRTPGGMAGLKAWAPLVLRCGVLALSALALWRRGLDPIDPVVAVVAYPLVGLTFGALLVAALTAHPASRLARVLSGEALGNWGRYSYGIYVFHFPLLGAIEWKTRFFQQGAAWLGGSHLPSVLVLAAIALPLSYALGWLSYHAYEKRFLALKRYFSRNPAVHRDTDETRTGVVAALPA